jgi:endonuclease/exonuclease/phosphatase family metal-dependent hydrolase
VLSEKHTVVVPDAKHQAGRRIEAEDRCVSLVTLDLARRGGAPLTLAATHLDQLSDELRLEQVQALTAFCADAGPHVLVGDFNVFQKADCSPAQWAAILADADSKGWPHPPERSAALDALLGASKYRDCFYAADNHREGHADPALALTRGAKDAEFPGATCWVTKPLLRIDYALLSPELAAANVAVAQYQRVLDEASDHFPVVVDLKLPPAGAAALAGGAVRRSAAREGSPMVEAGQSSDDDMAVEVN